MKRLIALILVLAMPLTACSTLAKEDESGIQPPKNEVLGANYQQWIKNSKAYLNALAITKDGESSLITDDSGSLAWGTSYVVNTLYRGYCATGDKAYAEAMSVILYRVFKLLADKDGDGYENWGTTGYSVDKKTYEEYCVHSGMVLSVAADFVNLVYSDSRLTDEMTPFNITYKQMADFITDKAINQVIPAFDVDWSEEYGAYLNRPGSGNYNGITDPLSLPTNQYLSMGTALMKFAMVCPDHRNDYLKKAKAMLANAKRYTMTDDNVTVYWDYTNALFFGDSPTTQREDFSHGMIDIHAAITGYSAGLVYKLKDLQAFAKTYETTMFTGTEENPLLTHYVDGTNITGSEGYIFLYLFDMSVYGTKIWQRGRQYMIHNALLQTIDSARVMAYHEDAPRPWSFSLSTPANKASGVSHTNTVFMWMPSVRASDYCLQISKKSDFSKLLVNRTKLIDACAIVTDIPANTKLYWRVIAENMKGDSIESKTFCFKTGK